MSPIVAAFLRSAILPAVLVTVGLFFLKGRSEPLKARLQALLLALGFLLGSYLLIDRLGFPPADVSESFSYLALLLVVFVVIGPESMGTRYFVRSIFVILGGYLVLFHLGTNLNSGANPRNLLAFFFLGLGLWSILERKSSTLSALALIVMPLISATGLSLLILFGASASLSQMVTILCALLGGAAVLTLLKPQALSKAALIPFLSLFVVAFMAVGHFYQDVNPWHMVFLSWPYFLLWIRDWLPIPKKPLIETVVLAVLSAGPLAYFIWGAFKNAGPLY